MSRDEDNDASLVLISSGIPALSDAEHIHSCPSHWGCLHSREKTGSSSPCLFGRLFLRLLQRSLGCVQNLPHHIIFSRPPCELGTCSYQFLGFRPSGAGIKVLRRSVRFPLHSSLSCPRRGFCCCISAFLLCVQEVREQTSECFDSCSPSPETNMRTEHRQTEMV